MFRAISILFFLTITRFCFAQETVAVSHSHKGGFVENYHVLKSNNKIKQGYYQLVTRKNTAIATGNYNADKRIGVWRFYDKTGVISEVYNYSTRQLLIEAPGDTTKTYITYSFDKKITSKDTVTKSVKIGGNYYGYMGYPQYFKIDPDSYYIGMPLHAYLQLLVSPDGNLAECKLVIRLKSNNNIVDTYLLKNDLLDEYQKQFVPATFNHQPVTSTISILVNINPDWTISFY